MFAFLEVSLFKKLFIRVVRFLEKMFCLVNEFNFLGKAWWKVGIGLRNESLWKVECLQLVVWVLLQYRAKPTVHHREGEEKVALLNELSFSCP